jgi:outer membrane protein OmpA-like peptidoglycan-associated protein
MSRIKLFLVSLLLLQFVSTATMAQSAADRIDFKPTPYMFVGLQGGVQTTFAEISPFKLITPTASLSFGAFFNPSFGARLHFNGLWNKGGFEIDDDDDFTYNYKYVTSDFDLLLNLCTLFGREDYYPFNVYLIGGVGLTYAWDNDDLVKSDHATPYAWKDNLLSHNLRLGAMLDYNISKHWSVNLEITANNLADKFNSCHHAKDDWQLTAQLGLAYKFGFGKRVHTAPVVVAPVEEYVGDNSAESAPALLVVPATEKKEVAPPPVKAAETLQKDIFFTIASSEIRKSEAAKIREVVSWLESHPTAVATITGHADAGTGNPVLNARYAQNRAEAVAKAITDAGIDASRLTVESKGDKVMPYGDNEKSRVAIVFATEK